MKKILIVDNCSDTCMAISLVLKMNNFSVHRADSGLSAMEWLNGNNPDLVLCDLNLKDVTGTELLDKIKKTHPRSIVIAMAAERNVKDVVAVFRSGARDFVSKLPGTDEILQIIKKMLAGDSGAIITARPARSKTKPGIAAVQVADSKYFNSSSLQFAGLRKQVALVAPTNFTVIISGESGSGKEDIARQIHEGSKRKGKPFVAIDCGALSKELAGSELFGHEKGAFTGALNQKIGSFEDANGGTIFLDEIGNLPYGIQVSLLRVVQERKIKRVGGDTQIDIDVRIVVASNVNLLEAANAGKFREDLYHRFNEFSIMVPSLRDRKQDILLLADHFLMEANAELGKNIRGFTKEVEYLLNNYIWYGNIRELKNTIKRAALLTDGAVVEVRSLPFEITAFFMPQFQSPVLVKAENQKVDSDFNTCITYSLKAKKINGVSEYEVTSGTLSQPEQNAASRLKNGAMFNVFIPAN